MNNSDSTQHLVSGELTSRNSSKTKMPVEPTDVAGLISSMAKKFKMIDTIPNDFVSPTHASSELFQTSYPSTSPPLLSPSVIPKLSVSDR